MKINMAVLSYLAGLVSHRSASAFSTFARVKHPIQHNVLRDGKRLASKSYPCKETPYRFQRYHQSNIAMSMSGTDETTFDDGKSPFFMTTPIYYVNDVPHIGHAYTSTACDVIARFMRLSGREVMFLSGTDEHGQKVEASAAKKGVDPQDFVDDVSVNFRDLLTLMNISNDYFIRTTDAQHKEAIQVSDGYALHVSSF